MLEPVKERIGGHEGVDVERWYTTEDTIIAKTPHDEASHLAVVNEMRALEVMRGSGFTPAPLYGFCQTDVGLCESVTDMQTFRRNCVKALATIRARGLRHGDLTGPRTDGVSNIICRDNWPWIVDWQESHRIGEPAPDKSPYSDSYLLMRTLANWPDAEGKTDTTRIARRWMAILEDMGAHLDLSLPLEGQYLLDLGCYQGDFVTLAATEGMEAFGVGLEPVGKSLWGDFPFGSVSLHQGNFVDPLRGVAFSYKAEVVLLLSTWPYVVHDYGRKRALLLLQKIMDECHVMYFETQLYGDGPGPEFLKTDSDVGFMLGEYGAAQPIVTVPVEGRDAHRTVWRVTRD